MKLTLTLNTAGDIRLQCLRDRRHSRHIEGAKAPSLVCSSELQEMTTPSESRSKVGFGTVSKGRSFTRYARKLIRCVGALMDMRRRSHLVFLTGTLPGSTPEAVQALAAWSGWVVQTVTQWLRDSVGATEFFGVWEYQKRGALHLHLCVDCGTVDGARLIKARWKARWIRIIDAIGKRSTVDLYARSVGGTWSGQKWKTRVDAQTVEKSVANYLSKYLSKGSASARQAAHYPPSSWYFCTRALQARLTESQRQVSLQGLSPQAAHSLFERASAHLAGEVGLIHSYVSPVDAMVKGVIALAKPIQASLIYDYIYPLFNMLSGQGGQHDSDYKCTVQEITILFSGRRVGSLHPI